MESRTDERDYCKMGRNFFLLKRELWCTEKKGGVQRK